MRKFGKIILTTAIVSSMAVTPVGATNVNSLENQKSQAESEVSSLQKELTDLIKSIDELDNKLTENGQKISQTTEDLDVAQKTADKQYADMKLRIRYMYEEDNSSYLEKILASESISDLINQASYVSSVHSYDRKMLTEYVETKEKIATLKTSLEEEQTQLEANAKELETKQETLQTTISEKKDEITNFDAALQAAVAAATPATSAAETTTTADAGNTTTNNSSSNKKPEASNEVVNVSPSSVGAAAASYACQFVGNPYVYGGTSLTNGADCSGFIMAVYAHFGYSLPHSSSELRSVGRNVGSLSNAQAGDIICYDGHVALYLGGGSIVHASTPATGIKYGSASYKTILAIRRIG